MLVLSLSWHGLFLNDLQRLSYPIELLIIGGMVIYLILGFLVTQCYLLNFPLFIAKRPLVRALITGTILGITTYLITLATGFSFNGEQKTKYILFDLTWQIFEQIVGGISVSVIYIWTHDESPIDAITRKLFSED